MVNVNVNGWWITSGRWETFNKEFSRFKVVQGHPARTFQAIWDHSGMLKDVLRASNTLKDLRVRSGKFEDLLSRKVIRLSSSCFVSIEIVNSSWAYPILRGLNMLSTLLPGQENQETPLKNLMKGRVSGRSRSTTLFLCSYFCVFLILRTKFRRYHGSPRYYGWGKENHFAPADSRSRSLALNNRLIHCIFHLTMSPRFNTRRCGAHNRRKYCTDLVNIFLR